MCAAENTDAASTEERTRRVLLFARIVQVLLLGGPVVGILLLITWPHARFASALAAEDNGLVFIEAALGGLAAVCLVLGFKIPQWAVRPGERGQQRLVALLLGHIFGSSLLEASAIAGLVLSFLGSRWFVVLLFYLAAGVALVLTFPKERKWRQVLG